MAEYFLGQIMMTGLPFTIKGFAQANGQRMPIAQNQALFALLETRYGGDGKVDFQLPNLQGRAASYAGASVDPDWTPEPYTLGETFGVEAVALALNEMPAHTHLIGATTLPGAQRAVASALLASSSVNDRPTYGRPISPELLTEKTISPTGGAAAHNNMQPFTVLNFQIALTGIFPSRN